MAKQFKGLTQKEVEERSSLGLVNAAVESYSPSVFRIFIKNFFNVITLALLPLMAGLIYLQIYTEVFAFGLYAFISCIINTAEEMRVKKRLQKLRDKFQIEVTVIREGKEVVIPSTNIVKGDYIVAREGEGIVADGKVLDAKYLQVDESALTGESDYLRVEEGNEIRSGSFVVTGECIYVADKVGGENYFNQLGSKSTNYREHKSIIEERMQKFIYIFTAISMILIALHFYSVRSNPNFSYPFETILLSLTTIVVTAIPQTILIIIILTFVISITKLARLGILVQKRGAIDDMAMTEVICIDKTGTITTNEMFVAETYYHNSNEKQVSELLGLVKGNLFGQNKTLITLHNYFEKILPDVKISENLDTLDQIPFNSKLKYSAFQIEGKSLLIGAFSKLKHHIADEKIRLEIENWINAQQESGKRTIVGMYFDSEIISDLRSERTLSAENVFAISINEELNPGIKEVIASLKDQKIDVKVISGDSASYVSRIANQVGLDGSKVIDMSEFTGEIEDVIDETVIFARATPEDKLNIIVAIQKRGVKVAMIGDGINDVLGLKQADVGIAMETGSKIAREISDIVLLKNDYKKIPAVFYEGNNIIFNLKLTTIIFLTKTFYFAYYALLLSLMQNVLPILPTSTLLFSFVGSSLGGYILMFARDDVVNNRIGFFKDIFISTIPSSIVVFSGLSIMYFLTFGRNLTVGQINTATCLAILCISIGYTLILFISSNKIKFNPIIYVLIIGIGLLVGTWQTYLPVWTIESSSLRVIIISGVYFAAFLFILFLRFVARKTNRPELKSRSFFLAGILTVIALLYPWRAYFAVDPVPLNQYDVILIPVVITITLLGLVYKFLIPYLRERLA